MNKNATAFCLVCLLLTCILAAPANSAGYILSLQNDRGQQLFSIPARNGEGFAIRYIHSVALTPVTDYFIIRDGKIFLDKTIYHDFGAGLPHAPESGQQMKTGHGQISITGYNREIPELGVRVGRVADHRMLIFDKERNEKGDVEPREVPLAGLSPPGTVIMFKVLRKDKNRQGIK